MLAGMARVFVVDDDPSVAMMLAEVVQFFGHESIVETDSLRAAQLVHSGWDALLSDYLMPGLSGVELCRIFREASPATRRVVVTAAPQEPTIRDALHEGIVQLILSKPTVLADVKQALMWL